MSDKHTQGRLATSESTEHWGRTNAHINDADGNMLGSIWCGTTEQNKANARRLVACWNACEGLPTAWIEGGAADILEHAKSLKSQRDELLAALLECERYGGGYTNCNESYLPPTVREKARAAIAKVNGGAA